MSPSVDHSSPELPDTSSKDYSRIYQYDQEAFNDWERWDLLLGAQRENLEKYLIIGGIAPEKVKEVIGILAQASGNYGHMLKTNARYSASNTLSTLREGHGQQLRYITELEQGKEQAMADIKDRWTAWKWYTLARLEAGKSWDEAIGTKPSVDSE